MTDPAPSVPNWIVTLVAMGITWIASAAVSIYRLGAVEKRIDANSTLVARIPQIELRTEQLERRTATTEDDIKDIAASVSEMKGDLKLILRILDDKQHS